MTPEEIEEHLSTKDYEELETILFSNDQEMIVKQKALKILVVRALQDEYYWHDL